MYCPSTPPLPCNNRNDNNNAYNDFFLLIIITMMRLTVGVELAVAPLSLVLVSACFHMMMIVIVIFVKHAIYSILLASMKFNELIKPKMYIMRVMCTYKKKRESTSDSYTSAILQSRYQNHICMISMNEKSLKCTATTQRKVVEI